jgi:hypothetical protein
MSNLANQAALEDWLGRTVDSGAADQALTIASDTVRAYCGHSITQILNDVAILDGSGTSTIMLPAMPINGIDLIEIDGEELDDSKYKWSRKGWVRRTDGILWPTLPGSISITYNHGYATTPGSITGVVLALAGRIVDGSSGIKQETIGSYSVTYGDPSPVLRANEQSALDAYRVTL